LSPSCSSLLLVHLLRRDLGWGGCWGWGGGGWGVLGGVGVDMGVGWGVVVGVEWGCGGVVVGGGGWVWGVGVVGFLVVGGGGVGGGGVVWGVGGGGWEWWGVGGGGWWGGGVGGGGGGVGPQPVSMFYNEYATGRLFPKKMGSSVVVSRAAALKKRAGSSRTFFDPLVTFRGDQRDTRGRTPVVPPRWARLVMCFFPFQMQSLMMPACPFCRHFVYTDHTVPGQRVVSPLGPSRYPALPSPP
jgi:hypothetical protein